VLHQIGVGALGPVFRTYEPTRDRLVAVKVFRLDVTPEQAAALAEELGRATEAGLFHPSIVEPVAAGLEGTVAYRAEEYVAAESLDVAMRHYAPASLDKALPFLTQLANAIDVARAAGVGHGALHPRDIFVTPDEARATGFGVVDALERLGLRAPVRRPYSAPERIAGQPWSTTADVFSLGAIAFELLTGRRASGPGDQMGSLNGGTVGAHADAIRPVLAKAMAEDPSARYQTASAFSNALSEAAALATPSSVAVTVAPPVQEPAPPPVVSALDDADGENVEPPEETESPETLDTFIGEPTNTPIDSPREAARKAIAARKRQPKPKPEAKPAALDLSDALNKVELPQDTPEAVIDDSVVVSAAVDSAVAAARADEAAGDDAPEEPILAAGVDAASALSQVTEEIPAKTEESSKAPDTASSPKSQPDELVSGVPVATLADVDLWHLDPITAKGPDVSPADVEPEMPAVAASLREVGDARVDPKLRDTSDRVVAVDEFRARESSSTRPEKTWPRASASERPMPSIAPVSRGMPPPTKLLETNDVSLVTADEPEQESARVAMMPIAIGLLLGLLLGYGGGYFVGWRRGAADTTTQLAQTLAQPAPTTTAQPNPQMSTPGTSGQSREFSEQAVKSPSAETPQRAPSSNSAAATKGSTPPPAPSNAAPSKPAPKPTPPPAKPAASKPTPGATTTTATAGTIVVRSSPAKAAVTVNGVWSGRTPLTLERRPFGDYVVRIVEPGYEVARETFKLSAGASAKTIEVTLKPAAGAKPPAQRSSTAEAPKPGAAAIGGLFIDSRPQGAKVILNGKPAGVTPLRLNEQPVGAYEVRLELADHQAWTATARVVGGETARVTGSMERIR
jgi:serine/threonine protein kinase